MVFHKMFRSTMTVSLMTLLSRITGLVRDVAFAQFLGSGLVADAFFVAFRIPNFFRRIFAEGAFRQVLYRSMQNTKLGIQLPR